MEAFPWSFLISRSCDANGTGIAKYKWKEGDRCHDHGMLTQANAMQTGPVQAKGISQKKVMTKESLLCCDKNMETFPRFKELGRERQRP